MFAFEKKSVEILKFGSSVLRDREDLPRAVGEIYRYVRDGHSVIAVVSAFEGETDALVGDAALFGAGPQNLYAPRYVALGDAAAAALLGVACDQAGLNATVLTPEQVDLRAEGPPSQASPVHLDREVFLRAVERCEVVIAQGFAAVGPHGDPVLLGRGGSDLTAVFFASALGLPRTRLIKDVDGVYDKDPAVYASVAARYDVVSYADALEVAGALVQPQAVERASADGIEIEVAKPSAGAATVVGPETQKPQRRAAKPRLRVGLAGCGIVGAGVADILSREGDDFDLCTVLVRDLRKKRPVSVRGAHIVTNLDAFFDEQLDIIVDVLSSGDIGLELTERAMAQGVDLVSANKQALAGRLEALEKTAQSSGAALLYSASVGGGAPMIETVQRVAAQEEIVRIDAIVNGTVNFILSELAAGADFKAGVEAAQIAGFAEADPSADLSGADAVAKARILGWNAFGDEIASDIPCDALDDNRRAEIARRPGVWRQITTVERRDGASRAQVAFARVEEGDFFADFAGERNGARIVTASGREVFVKGRGAGAVPTAHSICGDLGVLRRAQPRG
ncbi:MAG: homoserine dehydrogenase [Pseudomonadota bacterium]